MPGRLACLGNLPELIGPPHHLTLSRAAQWEEPRQQGADRDFPERAEYPLAIKPSENPGLLRPDEQATEHDPGTHADLIRAATVSPGPQPAFVHNAQYTGDPCRCRTLLSQVGEGAEMSNFPCLVRFTSGLAWPVTGWASRWWTGIWSSWRAGAGRTRCGPSPVGAKARYSRRYPMGGGSWLSRTRRLPCRYCPKRPAVLSIQRHDQ